MQKNEVKNFICSFLLSLLAVATVSKAILRMSVSTQKPKETEAVSVQNISLFRENAEPTPTEETTSTAPKVDLSALEALTPVPEPTKEDKIRQVRAEAPALDLLPQSQTVLSSAPVYMPEADINTDLAAAEEIRLDDTPDPLEFRQEEPPVETQFADISDTIKDEQVQTALSRQPVYRPEEDTLEEEKQSQMILASLDSSQDAENAYNSDEIGLIPLEESTLVPDQKITTLHHANKAQIAMLEPNALVNGIDSLDSIGEEEKSLDQADLKKEDLTQIADNTGDSPWVKAEAQAEPVQEIVQDDNALDNEISNDEPAALKAKTTAQVQDQPVDNPWVMARGNKYAKNKAVIEQFSQEPSDNQPSIPSADSPTSESEVSEPASVNISQKASLPQTSDASEDMSLAQSDTQDMDQVKDILQPKPLLRPIGEDTKVAYQMIDNLLIPIPDDIKNDANLTPDLSVTPSDKPKEKLTVAQPATQPTQQTTKTETPKTATPAVTSMPNQNLQEKDKESGLFKSIASWFSPKNEKTKQNEPQQTSAPSVKKSKKTNKTGLSFFQKSKNSDNTDDDMPVIMPAELRLSFQPNRAEISGQTLRWIHAFADNARDNNDVYIEVRIDGTSSFALQQKRLNLLKTILANRGVDARKINIIFTSREPNSFIIRNIRFNNSEEVVVEKENGTTYYRPW